MHFRRDISGWADGALNSQADIVGIKPTENVPTVTRAGALPPQPQCLLGKKGHSCFRIEMFVTVFISLLAFFYFWSLSFFSSLHIISCLISSLDSVLVTKVDNNYYNFSETHPNQFENICCQCNYIEIEQSNC